MITLITGENSYENDRTLRGIIASSSVAAERFDGASLELKQLPDLLMGGTLFASTRLVVVKNISENKTLWVDFGTWLGRVSDDVHLVLVEPKPDKRTKTYKEVQKLAQVYESKLWTERDTLKAEQWVSGEAEELGFELDKKCARLLVGRVGVDQWLLAQALQKLAVVDAVTPAVIEDLIESNPTENVFQLLELALRGDAVGVRNSIDTLKITEDPYRLFGLLSGQIFQLAAVTVAEASPAEIAKELGAHPFVISKLAPQAKRVGHVGARRLIAVFAEADSAMKTSADDPWLLVEWALLKTARI